MWGGAVMEPKPECESSSDEEGYPFDFRVEPQKH